MTCDMCNGTGWVGDRGPGIRGNGEYAVCDCVPPDQRADVAELKVATLMRERDAALAAVRRLAEAIGEYGECPQGRKAFACNMEQPCADCWQRWAMGEAARPMPPYMGIEEMERTRQKSGSDAPRRKP